MSFELPPLSTDPAPTAPQGGEGPSASEPGESPSAPEPGKLTPVAARSVFKSWPLAAQTAVGCGSGCAVLALMQLFLVWGALAVTAHIRPPDGLEIDAVHPKVVKAGVKFPLTLEVRNRGGESFTVQNVIGRASLLEKLTLSNPRPTPKEEANLAGQASWSYVEKVPVGGTWKLQFDAKASEPGDISERMDVQVNLAPNPVRIRLKVE